MAETHLDRTLDRRQRKSRSALQHALIDLIASQPYDSVTIDDVTEAADVARATFYAHYKDKSALLEATVADLISDLAATVPALAAREGTIFTGAVSIAGFRHAEAHRDLYLLVLSGAGGARARAAMVSAVREAAAVVFADYLARNAVTPRAPMSLISATYAGAHLLAVELWLGGELRGTAEEVASLVVRDQLLGVEWALGFEPGSLVYEPVAADADELLADRAGPS
ncbi:MAG TPA: TetR/AcrR family transcriptional regulator [Solirubrobacteraceae bacterium]|nr:TetR/AcrR family transcriptional regulator [Solirubrobacteraceae bacterium]